jgi:hypothetical protein
VTTDDHAWTDRCSGTDQCTRFKNCTAADVDAVGDHATKVDVAVDFFVEDDIRRAASDSECGTDSTALSGDEFDRGGVWPNGSICVDDDITQY